MVLMCLRQIPTAMHLFIWRCMLALAMLQRCCWMRVHRRVPKPDKDIRRSRLHKNTWVNSMQSHSVFLQCVKRSESKTRQILSTRLFKQSLISFEICTLQLNTTKKVSLTTCIFLARPLLHSFTTSKNSSMVIKRSLNSSNYCPTWPLKSNVLVPLFSRLFHISKKTTFHTYPTRPLLLKHCVSSSKSCRSSAGSTDKSKRKSLDRNHSILI
mmetsp:Transcript_5163/g.7826  ORF Transcript_5163/g.7826 Transcript_5163/m.7826 type:complete len:212 (-) Transcript_5163:1299-1934(-)